MENVKKFPMMLTKACIDPNNLNMIPLYQVDKNEVDEEFWVFMILYNFVSYVGCNNFEYF